MKRAGAFGIIVGLLLGGIPAWTFATSEPDQAIGATTGAADPIEAPRFTSPRLIDAWRSGGEPAITIAHDGSIIVASHPGYTLSYAGLSTRSLTSPGIPGGAELIAPTQGQSYMWKSTDGGQTFLPVSFLPRTPGPFGPSASDVNAGPRGPYQGMSDPDFAVDASGRIWFTDLGPTTWITVSWSDDHGTTWLEGNMNAAQNLPPAHDGVGRTDRPWVAAYGTTAYLSYNALGPQPVLATSEDPSGAEDRGQRFARVGTAPTDCDDELIADPSTGRLYAGCAVGLAYSDDGGATWTYSAAPIGGSTEAADGEPAIDADGNVYLARASGHSTVAIVRFDPDTGAWSDVDIDADALFPGIAAGTMLYPQIRAGSAGRIAVTFYGTTTAPDQSMGRASTAEWNVYNLIVTGADTDAPTSYASQITERPHHVGGICNLGTLICPNPSGNPATDPLRTSDRRLGDLFETTIDDDGMLHIAYAETTSNPRHTVSHVAYARMECGPRLVLAEDVTASFPTQG